jgi:hypothetical protein
MLIMKKPYFKLLLIIACLLICANARAELSVETRAKLSADLGSCAILFTAKRGDPYRPQGGYQDHVSVNRVFVFGYDTNGRRVCSYKSGGLFTSHQELEDSQCNQFLSDGWMSCYLYAKDNNIVYTSVDDQIDKALTLYKRSGLEEAWKLLDEAQFRGFAHARKSTEAKAFYLEGVRAIKEGEVIKAIDSLNKSWGDYGYIDAAEAEIDFLATQDVNQNWKKIRKVFNFLKEKDVKAALAKHEQLILSTEALYAAEQDAIAEQTKMAQAQDKLLREIKEKELKVREAIELKEAKIAKEQDRKRLIEEAVESKKIAKQQKLEDLRAAREAKAQERIRLAEERRIAREGDDTPDDRTCKSLGAKPGTNPYIQCRLKLTELANQHRLEQIQQQQAIEQVQRQAEQDRQLLIQQSEQIAENQRQQIERQRMLDTENQRRQAVAEEKKGWERLEKFGRALEGLSRTTPPVQGTMPHFLKKQYNYKGNQMCSYDDGTVMNIGNGICPNVIR